MHTIMTHIVITYSKDLRICSMRFNLTRTMESHKYNERSFTKSKTRTHAIQKKGMRLDHLDNTLVTYFYILLSNDN